jgi:hypothetical protein
LQEKQKEIKQHDALATWLNEGDEQLKSLKKEVKVPNALATRLEEKEKQIEIPKKRGQGAQHSRYLTGGEREQAQSAERGRQTAKRSERLAQGKGEAIE